MVIGVHPSCRRRLDDAGTRGVEKGMMRIRIPTPIRRRQPRTPTATSRSSRDRRHHARGRSRERSRRRPRGRDVPPAALEAAAGILAVRRHGSGVAAVVAAAHAVRVLLVAAPPRLVPVVGELVAVADLLLLGEPLPAGLDVVGLLAPLLADQLRDLRVREPRVLRCYLGLVVLAVEDEGCWFCLNGFLCQLLRA